MTVPHCWVDMIAHVPRISNSFLYCVCVCLSLCMSVYSFHGEMGNDPFRAPRPRGINSLFAYAETLKQAEKDGMKTFAAIFKSHILCCVIN